MAWIATKMGQSEVDLVEADGEVGSERERMVPYVMVGIEMMVQFKLPLMAFTAE